RIVAERHRHAAFELNGDVGRLLGRETRVDGPRVGLLRWLVPGVLDYPRLDAAPPQVGIHRIGAGRGHRYGNLVLLRVPDLVVARHAPLAHGGDDLQIGRQRLDRHVEADLVVAFAGTAVGDVAGAFFARVINQHLRDQWPRQRRGKRVDVLVQRAGLE